MAISEKFVARDEELARLNNFLDLVVSGQGQICFVSGEAGAGKTALVSQFGKLAQEENAELVLAVGICDPQTGEGAPYLPFREVLELLTGDVESKLAQGKITDENAKRLQNLLITAGETLVEFGPDLIGLFVPGATLLGKVGQHVAKKSNWADKLRNRLDSEEELGPIEYKEIDQDNIFEQYINVLRHLALQIPLVVVLDDLQWADAASLQLLFRLSRRLDGIKLMVIGTYRPNDVAMGRGGERHPLEPVLTETKRYFGDIIIDLDQAREERGRTFVDAYLDTEANLLDETFRALLYEQTQGQPLFIVELLREMQERGDLIRDVDGNWTEGPELHWGDLPSRVEGVMEERIARLTDEQRENLRVASIEGEQFTAEVMAEVQSSDLRSMVRELSGELQKQHRLVEAQGVERLKGQRISRYRFANKLLQAYLYTSLDEIESSFLHEDVGNALETLYGEEAYKIAVRLAQHFELAEDPDKARHYLQMAGEQAAAAYANENALVYLNKAIDLTPDDEQAVLFDLLLVRESVYDRLGRREEQREDLQTLEALAKVLGDKSKQAEVALQKAWFGEFTGDFPGAIASAQEAISLAQLVDDVRREAKGQLQWGKMMHRLGQYDPASEHLQQALTLAKASESKDVEAETLLEQGNVAGRQGDIAACKNLYENSRLAYGEIINRWGGYATLNNLGGVQQEIGEYVYAKRYFEQALAGAQEIGDRAAEAGVLAGLGGTNWLLGNYEEGSRSLELSLEISREVGDRRIEGFALQGLGHVLIDMGQVDKAIATFQEAVSLRQQLGNQVLVMESRAALARAYLAQKKPTKAQEIAEEVLTYLYDGGSLDGAEYPILIYLTCCRILRANEDPRLTKFLDMAYQRLQERAAQIVEEADRSSFLENVPWNQEILIAYRDSQNA